MKHQGSWALATLFVLLLAGCGKSPDSARAELEKQAIPVDEKTLLAQTKEKSDQATAATLVVAGFLLGCPRKPGRTAVAVGLPPSAAPFKEQP